MYLNQFQLVSISFIPLEKKPLFHNPDLTMPVPRNDLYLYLFIKAPSDRGSPLVADGLCHVALPNWLTDTQ